MTWRMYAEAATSDITTAITGGKKEPLDHLKDVLENIERAIETINEEVESGETWGIHAVSHRQKLGGTRSH